MDPGSMEMKKFVMLGAIVLVFSVVSGVVIARDEAPKRDRKARRHGGGAEMRKEIDAVLTDEQKARFKEQMSDRRKAHEKSRHRRDKAEK